jgi:hypothetical protein
MIETLRNLLPHVSRVWVLRLLIGLSVLSLANVIDRPRARG